MNQQAIQKPTDNIKKRQLLEYIELSSVTGMADCVASCLILTQRRKTIHCASLKMCFPHIDFTWEGKYIW